MPSVRPTPAPALVILLAIAACSSGALKPTDGGAGAGGRDAAAAGTGAAAGVTGAAGTASAAGVTGGAGITGAAGSTAGTAGGDGTTEPPLPEGGVDGFDGGPLCTEPAPFQCDQQIPTTGPVICGDYQHKPACDHGEWKCPPGEIDTRMCTCFAPPSFSCAGAHCTAQGWACIDGGTDVRSDATDASKDACDVGCKPSINSNFCQQGEVQWECDGGPWDAAAFTACRDPATNLQRYCCPPSFLAACR